MLFIWLNSITGGLKYTTSEGVLGYTGHDAVLEKTVLRRGLLPLSCRLRQAAEVSARPLTHIGALTAGHTVH